MVKLLDARVQRPAVLPERHRKQKLLLGRIAQQERPLGLPVQQLLRLVPVHLAPVEAAAGDLLQVRNQTVNEVDLAGFEIEVRFLGFVFGGESFVSPVSALGAFLRRASDAGSGA